MERSRIAPPFYRAGVIWRSYGADGNRTRSVPGFIAGAIYVQARGCGGYGGGAGEIIVTAAQGIILK